MKNFISKLAVGFFALLPNLAYAQSGDIDIRSTGAGDGYSIEFNGAVGVTAQQAGERTMQAGCNLARERGFSHFAVTYFGMTEKLTRVRTRRGRTTGRMGSNGQVTDVETTNDRYSNVSSGWSALNVVLVNDGGIEMLAPLHDIVDASSCRVSSTHSDD